MLFVGCSYHLVIGELCLQQHVAYRFGRGRSLETFCSCLLQTPLLGWYPGEWGTLGSLHRGFIACIKKSQLITILKSSFATADPSATPYIVVHSTATLTYKGRLEINLQVITELVGDQRKPRRSEYGVAVMGMGYVLWRRQGTADDDAPKKLRRCITSRDYTSRYCAVGNHR